MAHILKLDNVRLSFPKLDEPDYFKPGQPSRPGEKKRWAAAFHVMKTDPQKAKVDAILKAVATEKWGAKAATMLANILPDPKGCCWQDGVRKETPDVFILNTYRYQDQGRPLVIDSDLSHIYAPLPVAGKPGEFYDGTNGRKYVPSDTVAQTKIGRIFSGCYVNTEVEFWAQDNPSGKGLRATLRVIQFAKMGDAFGGSGTPVGIDAFGVMADGADADDLS